MNSSRISHHEPNPTHFPILLCVASSLPTSPTKIEIKQQQQQNQTNKKKPLSSSVFPEYLSHILCIVYPWDMWCVIQPTLLPKQLFVQMFITMSCWSGLRPPVSHTPSILNPHENFSWDESCCFPTHGSYGRGSASPVTS